MASAPAAFRVRVWAVMSRGRRPRGGRPLPEGANHIAGVQADYMQIHINVTVNIRLVKSDWLQPTSQEGWRNRCNPRHRAGHRARSNRRERRTNGRSRSRRPVIGRKRSRRRTVWTFSRRMPGRAVAAAGGQGESVSDLFWGLGDVESERDDRPWAISTEETSRGTARMEIMMQPERRP